MLKQKKKKREKMWSELTVKIKRKEELMLKKENRLTHTHVHRDTPHQRYSSIDRYTMYVKWKENSKESAIKIANSVKTEWNSMNKNLYRRYVRYVKWMWKGRKESKQWKKNGKLLYYVWRSTNAHLHTSYIISIITIKAYRIQYIQAILFIYSLYMQGKSTKQSYDDIQRLYSQLTCIRITCRICIHMCISITNHIHCSRYRNFPLFNNTFCVKCGEKTREEKQMKKKKQKRNVLIKGGYCMDVKVDFVFSIVIASMDRWCYCCFAGSLLFR